MHKSYNYSFVEGLSFIATKFSKYFASYELCQNTSMELPSASSLRANLILNGKSILSLGNGSRNNYRNASCDNSVSPRSTDPFWKVA
jgi:hypothetical protein